LEGFAKKVGFEPGVKERGSYGNYSVIANYKEFLKKVHFLQPLL